MPGLPWPLVKLLRAHRAQQNRERLAAANVWEDFEVVLPRRTGARSTTVPTGGSGRTSWVTWLYTHVSSALAADGAAASVGPFSGRSIRKLLRGASGGDHDSQCLSWSSLEPPIGIEPMTYSLRGQQHRSNTQSNALAWTSDCPLTSWLVLGGLPRLTLSWTLS